MSEIYIVTVPISGIFLEGIAELAIGTARIFSNTAALPFLGNLPFDLMLPNTSVPLNAEIKGVPPEPFDAEIRQLGIARYLLQVEIETPTNTITGVRRKEELEWAILPLRILSPARILLGLTTYCRGGFEHCGGVDWRSKMRQEGFLGSAPQAVGWSSFCG
ncbi:MAG: hypothetical protein NTZ34_07525, partial [Chloroflexi bacterium]|nr:hypothetical protein [Chloroflexota bacterium]